MSKSHKPKRYTVTLSECEMRRLTAYADSNAIDRPTALHRLVRQSLRENAAAVQGRVDKKQLGLFDTLQIDIFDNTTVVKHKE
ncbi:MAG: hypothetical protein J6I49_01635 [Bacteroidales bacterium]|nr:hypothetical protein [Bacteroidales bacterium]